MSALRLGRAVETRLAKRLKPLELRPGQLSVLTELETDENLSLSRLAARIGLDPGALVRQLDALEELGIVKRASDPRDGRRRRLLLTSSGREALRRAVAVAVELERELLAERRPEERAAIAASLAELQRRAVAA